MRTDDTPTVSDPAPPPLARPAPPAASAPPLAPALAVAGPTPPADLEEAEPLIREGMRAQKAGDLDAAAAWFAAVAAAGDVAVASLGWRHVAGVHRLRSEWDAALAAARRAAALAEDAGLRELFAEALNAEAIVYQMQGDLDRAAPILERMLEITADHKGRGIALQNLGSIAAQRGDFATARTYFTRSHDAFQRANYPHGVAFVLNNFGRAALDHGNARVARPMLENALGAARRVPDYDLAALAQRNLAEAALLLGDHDEAGRYLDEAERVFHDTGNRAREVECLRLRGTLAEHRRDRADARRYYERAYALATEVGALQEVARLAASLVELQAPGGGEPLLEAGP